MSKKSLFDACSVLRLGWWNDECEAECESPPPPTKKDAYRAMLEHFVREPARKVEAERNKEIASALATVKRAAADFDEVDKEELVTAFYILIPVGCNECSSAANGNECTCTSEAPSMTKRALFAGLQREAEIRMQGQEAGDWDYPYPKNWVDDKRD